MKASGKRTEDVLFCVVFLWVSFLFSLFYPHGVFCSQLDNKDQLNVNYLQYDNNRVYSDGVVNWSYDYTFVISTPRKKNFPEEAREVTVRQEKKPVVLSVRMSTEAKPETQQVEKVIPIQPVEKPSLKKEVIVFFPFNKSFLVKDQKIKLLSAISDFKRELKGQKSIRAEVTGSACPIGSESYNKKLSLRRAETVAKILEREGIKVTKIEGLGEVKESDVLCLNRKVIVVMEADETLSETGKNVNQKAEQGNMLPPGEKVKITPEIYRTLGQTIRQKGTEATPPKTGKNSGKTAEQGGAFCPPGWIRVPSGN